MFSYRPFSFSDLARLDPDFAEQMEKLRTYSDNELEALDMDFSGLQSDDEHEPVSRDNMLVLYYIYVSYIIYIFTIFCIKLIIMFYVIFKSMLYRLRIIILINHVLLHGNGAI